ncbi:patatin-like phospholipase family protein [Nannocystaceae bacterium ST9]
MSKRILSLDGGGTWALVQVEALIALYGEGTSGRAVLRDFDLVVANSGGALVVGALFEDFTLEQVRKLFHDTHMLARLFKPKSFARWRAKIDVLPRYVTRTKLAMLEEFLPVGAATKLADIPAELDGTDILLLAFDYDGERSVYLRSEPTSPSQSRLGDFPYQAARELSLTDAIHGSSTPPVRYFDDPATTTSQRTRRLWDGGLGGYNNPVLAGLCELLSDRSVAPQDLQVLSLGTGQVRRLPHRSAELLRARNPDVEIPAAAIIPGGDPLAAHVLARTMHDLETLATVILDDPPDAASYVAFLMMGHKPPLAGSELDELRLVRMNPVLTPIRDGQRWTLPSRFADPGEFAQLAALELDAHAERDIDLISRFARAWIHAKQASELPNQGIRQHWDNSLDFGDSTFAAAKRRWQGLINRA